MKRSGYSKRIRGSYTVENRFEDAIDLPEFAKVDEIFVYHIGIAIFGKSQIPEIDAEIRNEGGRERR